MIIRSCHSCKRKPFFQKSVACLISVGSGGSGPAKGDGHKVRFCPMVCLRASISFSHPVWPTLFGEKFDWQAEPDVRKGKVSVSREMVPSLPRRTQAVLCGTRCLPGRMCAHRMALNVGGALPWCKGFGIPGFWGGCPLWCCWVDLSCYWVRLLSPQDGELRLHRTTVQGRRPLMCVGACACVVGTNTPPSFAHFPIPGVKARGAMGGVIRATSCWQ